MIYIADYSDSLERQTNAILEVEGVLSACDDAADALNEIIKRLSRIGQKSYAIDYAALLMKLELSRIDAAELLEDMEERYRETESAQQIFDQHEYVSFLRENARGRY